MPKLVYVAAIPTGPHNHGELIALDDDGQLWGRREGAALWDPIDGPDVAAAEPLDREHIVAALDEIYGLHHATNGDQDKPLSGADVVEELGHWMHRHAELLATAGLIPKPVA